MRSALLLFVTLGFAWGQSLEFEVASIKKAVPTNGPLANATGCFSTPPFSDPGMYTCHNTTVALMAFQAYGLKQYQMTGVNDDKDKYTVRAKIPSGSSPEDIRLMLQNLLKERFKLQFHYDHREMAVFELRVARDGPKLTEASNPSPVPPPVSGVPSKEADGFPMYPPQPGRVSFSTASGLDRLRANAAPLGVLVTQLTSMTQQPFFDETGLTGKYDFVMTFTKESIGQTRADAEPVSGLSVFQSLEKELGLKAEKTRRKVDVFVIDGMDKSAAEN